MTTFNLSTINTSPQLQQTMQITTYFACRHAEVTTAPFNEDICPTQIVAKACPNPTCQSTPLSTHLTPRCKTDKDIKDLLRKVDTDLTLAGMNAEAALRAFSMAEPMLPEDIAAAGCSPDIVEALMQTGHAQRYAASNAYLGHRRALATLEELKSCIRIGAPFWAADMLSTDLGSMNQTVQRKLIALQQAVFRLTSNSYPAPGAKFHMYEGVDSFQQDWGTRELALLRQSDEGTRILALPLSNENILAAKACMKATETELATLLDAERASFFADYPGTEALHASGAMKSAREMLAEQSGGGADMSYAMCFAQATLGDSVVCLGPDVRELRPVERVASGHMARNSLTVVTR